MNQSSRHAAHMCTPNLSDRCHHVRMGVTSAVDAVDPLLLSDNAWAAAVKSDRRNSDEAGTRAVGAVQLVS